MAWIEVDGVDVYIVGSLAVTNVGYGQLTNTFFTYLEKGSNITRYNNEIGTCISNFKIIGCK